MITKKIKENGTIQYELVQGDSFKLGIRAKSEEPLIKTIKFNIMDGNYNILLSNEYQEVDGLWVVNYTSFETNSLDIGGDYRTEIEVTYLDNGVDTIEKGKLKVTEQGKE